MSRKISWVSALDPSNDAEIQQLEKKLSDFYSNDASYYADIDYTAGNWDNPTELAYQAIKDACRNAVAVCEVGCGSANILSSFPELAGRYSGCDFSGALMEKNAKRFPGASFTQIRTPNQLPFESGLFDVVFSVFVLEHSTRPHLLLDECRRVLKPGGRLIIFCPDFLGRGAISSQQGGWSEGTPRQKLKRGKLLDTFVTFFDNRIRIPFYCFLKRKTAEPMFLINTDPTVFYFSFRPDVDAVYVTFRKELVTYLSPTFQPQTNSAEMERYIKERNLIYLSFIKK